MAQETENAGADFAMTIASFAFVTILFSTVSQLVLHCHAKSTMKKRQGIYEHTRQDIRSQITNQSSSSSSSSSGWRSSQASQGVGRSIHPISQLHRVFKKSKTTTKYVVASIYIRHCANIFATIFSSIIFASEVRYQMGISLDNIQCTILITGSQMTVQSAWCAIQLFSVSRGYALIANRNMTTYLRAFKVKIFKVSIYIAGGISTTNLVFITPLTSYFLGVGYPKETGDCYSSRNETIVGLLAIIQGFLIFVSFLAIIFAYTVILREFQAALNSTINNVSDTNTRQFELFCQQVKNGTRRVCLAIIGAGISTLTMMIGLGIAHNNSQSGLDENIRQNAVLLDMMINIFAMSFAFEHWRVWLFPYCVIRKRSQQSKAAEMSVATTDSFDNISSKTNSKHATTSIDVPVH